MKHSIFLFIFFIYSSFLAAKDIAVVTLAVGEEYKKVVSSGIENKRLYCQQHGYDFICGEEILDYTRPIPWSKIQIILKTMENPSYKWIFWTDADAVIMNHGIQLEDLIDDKYNFIVSRDPNNYNTGHFLIKNCEWSREFLKQIYSHTECIDHEWWEQQAVILELETKPELHSLTKVIPQRLFNSYPKSIYDSLTATYQTGDFIIHFAGTREKPELKTLMETHSNMVINDNQKTSLDQYLVTYGFTLSPLHSSVNEGYMTEQQKNQFSEQLKKYPEIKSIGEVGLNAGHSTENFFQNCPNLKKLVSFDINMHPYTNVAVEYFFKKYKDRFAFVPGDSLIKVRAYAKNNPNEKFDLIYVDGNHTYSYCLNDILNFKSLAHPETILWVDDYNGPEVFKAVNACVELGEIKIESIHSSDDSCGHRSWIEARYLFPK
ncbi:MAG: class I SAM-dependent methyltransferase [Parachlamydiaceae bacterium]|nr:class I SAM-dependent methyltransferase [Parachlamydiaceae bacterium]